VAEIVEDYGGYQIVRETTDGYTKYHFEGPLDRLKSFENPDRARLYANVYEVTGGFREEKTGERGVPPAIARAREDVLAAYLVSNPSMGVTYVARAFDVEEDVVRNYCQMVQERAQEQREGADE